MKTATLLSPGTSDAIHFKWKEADPSETVQCWLESKEHSSFRVPDPDGNEYWEHCIDRFPSTLSRESGRWIWDHLRANGWVSPPTVVICSAHTAAAVAAATGMQLNAVHHPTSYH